MDFSRFTFLLGLLIFAIYPIVGMLFIKVRFNQNIRYIFPSILVSCIIFLLWDIKFTEVGIWNYNPELTVGLSHKGLPVEQWLFYLLVPFSAMVVYEYVKRRYATLNLNNIFTAVSLVLVVAFAIIAYQYRVRFYTFFTFLFTTIYLVYTIFRKQFKPHLTALFLTYLLMLIPYALFSFLLTSTAVIAYHQEQVLNVWLGMMPVENLVFLFLLLLINLTVFEYLSERKFF